MDPEIWVVAAAVFVSGGAIGTVGTLLTQWLVRGLRNPGDARDLPDPRVVERLRADLATLVRKVRNMDERLEFQEQLLSGASPTRSPPRRLAEGETEMTDADTPAAPAEGPKAVPPEGQGEAPGTESASAP